MKARVKHLVVLLVVAVAVAAAMPITAAASSGGDVQPGKKGAAPTARDVAWSTTKLALAREFGQVMSGRMSPSKYAADLAGFQAAWRDYLTGATPLQASPDTLQPPAQYSLSVPQYPENPWYYCGPAAVTSSLAYFGGNSHDGETLSQSCLAGTCGSGSPNSTKYLETNYFGYTPWTWGANGQYDIPVPQSINYWRTGNYNGYYLDYMPTSVSDYEFELTYDIAGNPPGHYPLNADIEEVAGGLHLPGHPVGTEIQHWITLYGYNGYGSGTSYIDPVANSPAYNYYPWNTALPYNYGYPSTNIFTLVTDHSSTHGPFGIAW